MNLTNDQQQALEAARRMSRSDSAARVMILRGSAGTGKTSLVREIMQELRAGFDHLVVCAPTNKAAKVLRQKTGGDAGTIHRLLYSLAEDKEGRLLVTKSKPKPDQRVLFIVDEASMVSDRMEGADALFQGSQVLSDLLAYFRACAPDSRMIFVGDPCQLPPIGYDSSEPSPALHAEYLMAQKGVNVVVAELKEVVRQAADSYILQGATSLRNHLLYGAADYEVTPKILPGTTASIRKYLEYYRTEDESQVMKLAWTNQSVNWWNLVMRERLDLAHGPLMPGSRVLVDKGALVDGQMLAKGELGHVFEVNGPVETFADLRFLPITLMIMDEDGVVIRQHRTKAMLDHLHSHKGQLWPEQEKHLRAEAMRENRKYRDSGRPEDDPYVGALRLRYAYALTCHKAQGSEYENVIVNPYLPPGDLRWLYTAVTRAKKELFTF